jgi:hypothetical protein
MAALMEEIEIALDEQTAAWVEALAAEQKQTVSEFVENLLRQYRSELQKKHPRDVQPEAD